MDRQQMILEKGRQMMEPIFQDSMEQMMKEYKLRENEILNELCGKVAGLFELAKKMQEEGARDPITDLGICYLLSSNLTGNYELRLDLYDRDFYLDEEECCTYWEPEFLTTYLKKDREYFKKEIRKQIPQIKTYEMQDFLDLYRNNYMYILLQFFQQMLPEIFKRIEKKSEGITTEEFRVIFGEYMGNFDVIYGKEEES